MRIIDKTKNNQKNQNPKVLMADIAQINKKENKKLKKQTSQTNVGLSSVGIADISRLKDLTD